MESIYIFYAFTAGSLWLLSFLFLMNVSHANAKANRWLGAFYLFLACTFTQIFIETTGFVDTLPLLVHILELPRWAMLPCFYISIMLFVNPARKSLTILLHLIPAFLFLLFSLLYLIPHHFNPVYTAPALPAFVRLFIRYFFLAQVIVYWCLSFAQLLIHARNIRLLSSSIEEIDLAWIRYTLFAVLLLAVVWIFRDRNVQMSTFAPVIYFIGVCLLAYFSLKQGVIYAVPDSQLPELNIVLTKKHGSERLTSDQVDLLKHKVIEVTKKEKLYLEPGLTLPALSERIGISTHELSYVLNAGLTKNFYQFINEMRVEEAKRLLSSGEATRLDMIGIATYAGFNSKTTFNTTFKKMTGQTPSEFLKLQRNSHS